jgi:hypothetical protein
MAQSKRNFLIMKGMTMTLGLLVGAASLILGMVA